MTITPTQPAIIRVSDDLTAAGYTDKEISLIGYCWQDSEAINQSKTSLAMHLWELKQEMDAKGSKVAGGNGGGSTKSRFWAAFEAGHLPYAGDKGRTSTETCLKAAQFLEGERFPKELGNRFCNLAPATICEISNLEDAAQQLVYESVQSSDFIGVAAVRLIAHESDQDVFTKLREWINSHAGQAVTPKTIRALRAEVETENLPASGQTVDASTADRQAAAFERIMGDLNARKEEIQGQNNAKAVNEELKRHSDAEVEALNATVRQYNHDLNEATAAVHALLSRLQSISRIHGTRHLFDLREISVNGVISVADDLDRIKAMGGELMEVAQLASSCNEPTGIDMETVNVDQL